MFSDIHKVVKSSYLKEHNFGRQLFALVFEIIQLIIKTSPTYTSINYDFIGEVFVNQRAEQLIVFYLSTLCI